MSTLKLCDACGKVIDGSVKYFDLYEVLEGKKETKPCMPVQELCPICMDSLRNNWLEATVKDRIIREATHE